MKFTKKLKIDKNALKRFKAAADKSAKAAQYWMGGYLRIEIQKKYPRRTRRKTTKSGKKDERASIAGQPPFTWAHKRTKTVRGVSKIKTSYPLRDVRFALLGDTGVIAGVYYYKRAKGSTAATVPALHEHGGTAPIQQIRYFIMREGKPQRQLYGNKNGAVYNRRSDRVSRGSRRSFGNLIKDGRVDIIKTAGSVKRVQYPKRPAVKPAGMSAARSAKMGKAFHIMRRKTKQYYKAKSKKAKP